MKNMKKLASLLLALVMVFSLATTAFAADNNQPNAANDGKITIQNAAKGETYKVVKLFDASATGTQDGSIVYTGTIPDTLTDYFEVQNGYIVAKENIDITAANNAMKAWADTQTPVATKTGEGGPVVFENLPYGYYIVTTTQGSTVSLVSTNKEETIYDKNAKTPGIVKKVNDEDVDIGQAVTYTATSTTTNWLGSGENAKQVVKYEIFDTLPDFLSNVTVTSIVVDNDGNATTTDDQITLTVQQFDNNKKITIDWVDDKGNSLYNNGALLIVTYTAKVTAQAVIDGAGNKNEVTLTPYVPDPENPDTPKPWDEKWTDDEVIKTYAAALKKVDENQQALAGATFYVNGLTVTGSDGNYTVVSYDSTSTAKGTVMTTDAEGKLIIKGLNSDASLTVYEETAPAGYNKLTDPVTLTPTIINETVTVTTTTVYYDENGNVTTTVTENKKVTIDYNDKLEVAAVKVVNNKGSMLPETGGMGTTLFYVMGGLMMLAAVVLLATKKRMGAAE